MDAIAKHINDGNLGKARSAIKDLPGGGNVTGKKMTNVLDAAENPLAAATTAPSPAAPPPRSPAGRLLEDEIAHHSQGHWPGEDIPAIRQRAVDVMGNFDQSISLPNGRTIYRRGDTVVTVNNSRVEGSVYRPTNEAGQSSAEIAKAYVDRWKARGGQ